MQNTEPAANNNGATNKVRKITNILLGLIIGLLLFNIIANRLIPITDNARI